MLTLRKDVKLGLMIGAIVLSVLGVYLILNALAGSGPRQVAGAVLVTEPDTAAAPVNTQAPPTARPIERSRPPTPRGGGTVAPAAPGGGNDPADPQAPNRANDPWASFDFGDTNVNGGRPPATQEPPVTGQRDPRRPADPVTPPGTQATQEYEIQAGDTFSSIAQRFYGDAKHFNLIVVANPSVNPNRLKLGTRIVIPPLPATARGPKDDVADVGSTIDPARQYVVQPGDSLNRIATALYGDSRKWQVIWQLNKKTLGEDPTKLKPGMVLLLPEPPTQSTAAR